MLPFLERFSFYRPEHEFLYGIVLAFLLFLLVKLLLWLLYSKKCNGIAIEGERGQLFITSHAIEDFVIRTLADRDEMVIDRVKLTQKAKSYSITILLRVSGETNVHDLRPIIEERVFSQTNQRIGIDSISSVNIILKNFSAKEKQIKSRHKLALQEYKAEEKEENEDERNSPPALF